MGRIVLLLAMGLAACGGPREVTRAVPSASGPISAACLAADRDAASASRCGCVQAVANRSLSPSQQRRGASWFSDPHTAQEVRQSDRRGDERMWQAWKAFVERAESTCRGS